MQFVDTHSHLYSEEFDSDRQAVIERALEAGVSRILLPDVDSTSRKAMLSMAEHYPMCRVMIGVHPTSINDNEDWEKELEAVQEALSADSGNYCAVGEIGLDLYWSRDFEAQQREAFAFQVELALKYNLPIAVHCRDAWEPLIESLEAFSQRGVRGVIHAFSGTFDHYTKLKSLGNFLFGIGGVVTFKKSALAAVVAQMDLQDIVLETDAPYLTPTPHRGKRNEPAYIPLIAQCVASLQAVDLGRVADVTTESALKMFYP